MEAWKNHFDTVAVHYARVLQGLPPAVREDIASSAKQFLQWAKGPYWSFISHPKFSAQWQENVLQGFFSIFYPSRPVQNFFRLLCQNGRLGVLPSILEALQCQIDSQTTQTVYLKLARPSCPQDLEKLKDILWKKFQKEPLLHVSLDPALLFGGILVWNHWMVDASASALFHHFRKVIFYEANPS